MTIRGTGLIRRGGLRLRRRGCTILLYHRVAELVEDTHQLSVPPELFRAHMTWLRNRMPILALSDLAQRLESRQPFQERCAAVTFDDGYADNLLQAKPILEDLGIPATVFVSTGNLGSHREFWWDDLERILLLGEGRPDRLELTLGGGSFQWRTSTLEERRGLYHGLHQMIRLMSGSQREELLRSLRDWAGLAPDGRRGHRSMTSDEVCRLEEGGLIQVGAHSIHHVELSSLPPEEQESEIVGSRERLEEILGRKVDTFAYPFGGASSFNEQSVEICRRAGFRLACARYPGIIRPGESRLDPFRLPRFLVRSWPVRELARRARRFWEWA